MVELKTPKPEPVSEIMASCKLPRSIGDSLQQLESRGGNNSPTCVLGTDCVSSCSSSDDEAENESGSEDSQAASSDHSDRSDSDEDEYKVATDEDEDDDDEDEESEEGRPPRAKEPNRSSDGVEVKSDDGELYLKKKSRVKITPKRTDSWRPTPRNSNPGRRRVGGRIYDSVLGKTCHWCRQKTVELHVECILCPIRFCGPCLLNRNGENADLEIMYQWICPKCRGGCGPGCKNCCNCGPCRKAQGLGPTGQLVSLARRCGFSDVHDYLVHQKTKESAEDIARRKKGRKWSRDSGALFRSSALSNHPVKEELKEDEDEEANGVEEAELYGTRDNVSSSDEEQVAKEEEKEENEVVKKAKLFSAAAKVKAEPVYCYEDTRKRKTSDEPRMGKISDEPRKKKISGELRTSSSDRACDISGSKSRKTDSPAQTSISEDPSEDIWASQSCETVSRGNSSAEGGDFARELESALRRPFSTHQFKEMWDLVRFRKRVMKLRQTRSRAIEVPGSAEGLSYLDHYPDLAEKLAKSTSPEDKLRLLRGFLFWVQRSCMEGAYRPWRDSPIADDSGDCTEISGPDCEIIRVLLAIDEDEDNVAPEWEDKKPTIKLADVRKKFLSEKQQRPVPHFPVKVKVEKEEEDD